MLTGPTPTLASWITYWPEVETGMLTLAMPLEEEFAVPSTLPLGSITTSVRHVDIGLCRDREA